MSNAHFSQTKKPKTIVLHDPDFVISKRKTEGSDLHVHTFFELEYYLNDCGCVFADGYREEIKKGTVCISVPTHTHQINTDGKVLELYNLAFSPTVISSCICDKLTRSPYPLVFRLDAENSDKAVSLLELIRSEQEKNQNGDCAKYCIQALLSLVTNCEQDKNKANKIAHPYIKSALEYVNSHFKENVTLPQVASVIGMNSAYFSALFHKTVGMSFKEYLLSMRINYAKALIKENGNLLTFICYESGFNSYSAFSRAFYKFEGMRLQEYRNI